MRRSIALGAAALLALGLVPTPASAAPAPAVIQPGTSTTCSVDPHYAKHDMRGMWIASVVNIDWPSKPGLSAAQSQAELLAWFDLAVQRNLNTVVLQVRPTADTFWPSDIEPWSKYLTGTQGGDPGYDPMAFAVEQAHARGLELHAWYNPYRITMAAGDEKNLVADHPALQHPEWVVKYGKPGAEKWYFNPGLPEVREHVVKVILESVARYDLDAVHFDDYFYPYVVVGADGKEIPFDDAAAYATYGQGMSLSDWRRDNVNKLIDAVREGVRATRPGTQFGVSPAGVWRNASADPEGSDTAAGAPTYDSVYADTRLWLREGMVDYMLPQVYWSKTLSAARYTSVTDWWAAEAAQSPRSNLYIGEASYKVANNFDKAWSDPREMVSHLEYTQGLNEQLGTDAVKGHVYYNANAVRDNKLGHMDLIQAEWYSKPALTPRTPWLDGTAPSAPTQVKRNGNRLTITGPADAHQYVVYRVEKKAKDVTGCDLADTRNVVAILQAGQTTWTDPDVTEDLGHYTWLVSAVDRGSNESGATLAR